MTKEVQMTIRLDRDLRNDFTEAVSAVSERSGSQLVRQFMRQFARAVRSGEVVDHEESKTIGSIADEIAKDAIRSRIRSAEFGIASVGLEGLDIPKEYQDMLIARAKNGNFDGQELVKLVTNN